MKYRNREGECVYPGGLKKVSQQPREIAQMLAPAAGFEPTIRLRRINSQGALSARPCPDQILRLSRERAHAAVQLHGGLGPWFDEFEARSIKNAKNNRVDGLARTQEADALQFGTDAITWVFATAKERIKKRYP